MREWVELLLGKRSSVRNSYRAWGLINCRARTECKTNGAGCARVPSGCSQECFLGDAESECYSFPKITASLYVRHGYVLF